MDKTINRDKMRIYILIISFLCCLFSIQAQTYEELVDKSFDYLEKDDLQAAKESLKAAMHKEPANPSNFLLLNNLGTIQRRLGEKEDAILSYTAALSLNPKSIIALEGRASLYSEMNKPDKAINDYTALLHLQPTNADALYSRGILYVQQKNFLEAEADFEKMLEQNEKSVRARKGYAILENMRGNQDEAERIYNYLISEVPKNLSLYIGRAEVYFMKGKNARALADINKVLTSSEKPDAYLFVLRGKVKLAQYEKVEAAKDFQIAKEMGYDPVIIEDLMKMCQ